MTITQRRILTMFFILVFLVITPTLFFYAAGYRYDIDSGRIEQVGLVQVTTIPNDTTFIINGQEHFVGNELVLARIKPASYDMIITKDGYHPWFKHLTVSERQSVLLRDIILFADTQADPFELFTLPYTLLAENDKTAVFQNTTHLLYYNKIDRSILEFELEEPDDLEQTIIDPQAPEIVFKQNDQWMYLDFERSYISKDLPEANKYTYESIGLFGFTDTSVLKITPQTFDAPILIEQNLVQDLHDVNWILATEPALKNTFLYSLDAPRKNIQLVTTLKYSDGYKIVDENNGFITIHDQTNQILYLVDTRVSPAAVESLHGVHDYAWSNNHLQLLTATDFELTIHHFGENRRQELLLRVSKPITETMWHPSENHVFYISQDTLHVIERDDRDRRNDITLTDAIADLHLLHVNEDENILEYVSTIGNSGTGFFRLDLR